MIQAARRLDSVQEYYFATKLREVRNLMNSGKLIINAGIGNPDLLPPDHVLPALAAALQDPKAHGYQSYLGLPELRSAMAGFYHKQYQVDVNFEDLNQRTCNIVTVCIGHITSTKFLRKKRSDIPHKSLTASPIWICCNFSV